MVTILSFKKSLLVITTLFRPILSTLFTIAWHLDDETSFKTLTPCGLSSDPKIPFPPGALHISRTRDPSFIPKKAGTKLLDDSCI